MWARVVSMMPTRKITSLGKGTSKYQISTCCCRLVIVLIAEKLFTIYQPLMVAFNGKLVRVLNKHIGRFHIQIWFKLNPYKLRDILIAQTLLNFQLYHKNQANLSFGYQQEIKVRKIHSNHIDSGQVLRCEAKLGAIRRLDIQTHLK